MSGIAAHPRKDVAIGTLRNIYRQAGWDGMGHGARNFSVVRKFALATLRNDTRHAERSLRRRRKLADRRPEYRVELLALKPRQ